VVSGGELNMNRIPNAGPQSLAACLGAAQSDAERFFGDGPVRLWQPRFQWRPWAAGAALVAVVAVLALLWPWATRLPPEAAPVAADPVGTLALAPAAALAATVEAASDPAFAHAPASVEAPMAAANPASGPLWPENMEAWALDPHPLGAADAPQPVVASLVNTPVIPDEFDATPADESAVDDDPVEPPAE